MTEKTYGLVDRQGLPKKMSISMENAEFTHAIHLTYKRVVGHAFKTNFQTKQTEWGPNYGGAIAVYPRELGFQLDTESLLPEID
jgi:hypothetical protein